MSRLFKSKSVFVFLISVFIAALLTLAWIFHLTYRDSRWRDFDFHSRQAAYDEIYSVAEIPILADVQEVARDGRLGIELRFAPDIETTGWTVRTTYPDKDPTEVFIRGPRPFIRYPANRPKGLDSPRHTVELIPQNVKLPVPIVLKDMRFYGMEIYEQAGLGPNYLRTDSYRPERCSVPIGSSNPFSIAEWAGIDGSDPEVREARKFIEGKYDPDAPTIAQIEDIYRFCSDGINGGIPDARLQASSPLETYYLLKKQGKSGWCENQTLLYYLFANAAGIKTRYVNVGGYLGDMRLTGHHFCESWIPEENNWIYVDVQQKYCHLKNDATGEHLNAIQLKRLDELGLYDGLTVTKWDSAERRLVKAPAIEEKDNLQWYFNRQTLYAFYFGYGKTKSFSKLRNFLFYPRMIYSSYRIPAHRFAFRRAVFHVAWGSLLLALIQLGGLCICRRPQ